MIEARALLTSLTAVILAAGCTKNTSSTEATSEATADVATSSASEISAGVATTSGFETTGSPLTSTASSSTTTTSEATSDATPGTATPGSDSSTGEPAPLCHLAYDKASCEAGVDCVFIPGLEMFVRNGECVAGDLGEVGFCYYMAGGGSDTPSFYYEVETARVFAFLNSPEPPAGWADCTCSPPSPEACLCWSDCNGETSSSG